MKVRTITTACAISLCNASDFDQDLDRASRASKMTRKKKPVSYKNRAGKR